MIDIRNIEMVTPDLQRQSLIESNQKLKYISYILFSALVLSIAAYAINEFNQKSKDK